MGKDINITYGQAFDLPMELPLYFYKNPKKATRKGSVGVEKIYVKLSDYNWAFYEEGILI